MGTLLAPNTDDMMIRVALPLLCLAAIASGYKTVQITPAIKKVFLDLHNKFRAETGGGQPDLVWDDALAKYADDRISDCTYGHDPAHKYGENLYWRSAKTWGKDAATRASNAWHSEIQYIHDAPNWGCAYGATRKTCGHYTQQVWKDTKKVGCAIINTCPSPKVSMVYCEYSPKGNLRYMINGKIINTPPY